MSDEKLELLDPYARMPIYKKKVLGSIKDALTYTGPKVSVTVDDIRTDDKNSDKKVQDIEKLKELKLKDGTLASDIRADLTIKTQDGTKKLKDVYLGTLPSLTPHRSFLIGGTEYVTPVQARLRPGVYTRVQENGIVESHFNFAKTSLTKIPFRIELEPESSLFKVSVAQGTVPLYPLLRAIGVTDSQMAKAWGGEILEINKKQKMTPSGAVIKFMEIVTGEKGKLTERDAIDGFMSYLSGARLDADVTKITLGKSFDTVTPEAILDATKKIVAVNKGDEKPDDRDAIVFKSVHTFDDFIDEAVQKAKRTIQTKMNRNIQKYGPVAGAIPKDDIVKAIMHPFIGGAGLASYVEQYNPYQVVGETHSISVMGEGGLGSINAATMEARAVHPSSIGVIDPIGTPQSEKVGLKQKIAIGAMRRGDSLVTKVYDVSTKKEEYMSPPQLYNKYVAMADQYDWDKKKFISDHVRGTYKGDIGVYPKDKIEYIYVEQKRMFSYHTLSVPFMSANQGNRMLMSDNMLDQIIPVEHPDVPLVMPHKGIVSSAIAQTFDRRAKEDGEVVKVSNGAINIKTKDGIQTYPVYKSYPLNNAYLDSKPLVSVGDHVKAGQVLTESNFTKNGHVALGKNLLTAFMPYKGYNHEDAIVISESAAKKMSSKHMYKYSSKLDDNSIISRGKFSAAFPSVITKENYNKLSPEGIIMKGEKVSPGDIIIAHMTKRNVSEEVAALGRVHKAFMRPWKATPVTYDGEHEGIVRDSIITGTTYKVLIESSGPTEVGDKFVNYHAAKGIVGKIIPDSEMPHTKDGKPVDVLLNTAGIIGRINPGQVLEMAAGKVAEKTGKPFYSRDFDPGDNHLEHIMKEMKKHGVSDKEELIDPVTGKSFGNIATGPMHMFKLKHRATDKLSVRSRGGYDVDMKPSRGGDEGSKRIDTMLYHALLAHGAKNNLQESSTWKGDRSDDFWNALQTGSPLPPPKVPFVFEKMVGMMKGAGINVEREGDNLKLSPLTDHQIVEMSKGEISEPTAVRAKNFAEIKGGLFDRKATGGVSGKNFSHIKLSEPVMNPVFTKTVAKLLGMTSTKVDSIASGQTEIDVGGKKMTGGVAIQKLLKDINVDKTLDEMQTKIKVLKGTKLNDANYVIHVLQNLKDLKEKPSDAFVLHNIPVIPPMFRPIYPTATGQLRVSPLNFHYQDIMLYNKALQEGKKLPDELKQDARRDLYRSIKATMGMAPPLQTTIYRAQTDKLPGLLEIIRGDDGAKGGFFQDKVWAKSQDLSARSVIAPGPELGIDEASIPEDMAWKLYRPLVVRQLVRVGKKTLDAMKEIDNRSPLARAALNRVIEEHPVLLNRAPTLHKYGVLAFKPKLSDENVMRLPPFVLKGLGADFDGDAMQAYVPVSNKAVEEAKGMFPSKHGIHPATGDPIMVPTKDTLFGLYELSRVTGSSAKKFRTLADAEKAVHKGTIKIGDVVEIGAKKITTGQAMLSRAIPGDLYKPGDLITSKKIAEIARKLSRTNTEEYASVMNKLKDLGDEYSHGFTIGISDLNIADRKRTSMLKKFKEEIESSPIGRVGSKISNVIKKLEDHSVESIKKQDSPLYHSIISGAGGGPGDIRQLITSPVTVEDHRSRPIPTVFQRSYGEGLGLSDYWMASYGARKGVVGRSLMTFEPGTVMKRTMSTMAEMVISIEDCGTLNGIESDIDDNDILDRCLAEPVAGLARNTIITPSVVTSLEKKRIKKIKVRSPLTCEAVDGICAKCFGVDHNGNFPRVGANVGTEYGQYLTEPLFASSMKSFHTGSAVTTRSEANMTGFQAARQLLEMKQAIRGKAAIASKGGTVTNIEAAPAGGHYIDVDGFRHYSLPGHDVVVKKGERVAPGQKLSLGALKPQEFLQATKDPLETQKAIVGEMKRVYAAGGYKKLHGKTFELFARTVGNFGTVKDPGDSHYITGDTVKLSEVNSLNKDFKNKIKVEPQVYGIEKAPSMSKNWLARLGFTRLKNVFEEMASIGSKSNIKSGTHPLPKYVYGQHFGEIEKP